MAKVILYDIPSKPKTQSWSLNPWKTRMILNYKGIDYNTEWVEFPDIVSTFKAFGLDPNDPNAPGYFTDYSCPAIRYEDDTLSMDSWKIAHELERRYPSPALFLDDPVVIQVRDDIVNLILPIAPFLLPRVPLILNKESQEYFELTREEQYGMPLSQLAEKGNEECWEKAKEPVKKMGDLLKRHGGPFFLGETVSYADFILVSFLYCMRQVNENAYQRYLEFEPSFGRVYEASQQWLAKDD